MLELGLFLWNVKDEENITEPEEEVVADEEVEEEVEEVIFDEDN